MNNYELTLVLDGKSGAAKKKKVTEALEKNLEVLKGKITDSKDWGVKDLAYKMAKSTTGLYLYFELELDGKGAKALNEKLRVDSEILRFLVVKK